MSAPPGVPASLWVPDRFERAVKNQSTAPSYLMVSVVNDAPGESKRVCIEGTTLFDAVRFQNGFGRGQGWSINQDDQAVFVKQILANPARTYHFKTEAAWKIVQPVYTPEYLALVQNETRNQSTEELANRFDGMHSPGGFFDGDLQPGNKAAYAAAFAYVLTERGLYVGRGDFSGSLYIITPKMLAQRDKEQQVSDTAGEKRKAESRAFAARLPGYGELTKKFIVTYADVSLLVTARSELYALSVTLQTKKPSLITELDWINPVNQKKNGAQCDWNDFMPLTAHIERVARRHPWLQAWKNASPNRRIEAEIFGATPLDASDAVLYQEVTLAWKDAGLSGLPYCELILRRTENHEDGYAVVYLPPPGSRETRALITSTRLPNRSVGVNAFWLDRLTFSSWKTADPRECVVVSPNGAWKRIRLPLRTPIRP